MAKKQNSLIYVIAILLIAIVILSTVLVFMRNNPSIQELSNNFNSELKWSVPENTVIIEKIDVNGSSVTVFSGCKSITAETSPERAATLFNAINNRTEVRPDIYQSFASTIESFDVKLEGIIVHRFDQDVFYSDAYFRVSDQILQLDMKPSDAMSLALRSGAPIYYNSTIFSELGENVC